MSCCLLEFCGSNRGTKRWNHRNRRAGSQWRLLREETLRLDCTLGAVLLVVCSVFVHPFGATKAQRSDKTLLLDGAKRAQTQCSVLRRQRIRRSKLKIDKRVGANWTANDSKVRFALKIGVSYTSDPQNVKATLLEIAAAHPDVLHEPSLEVIFSDLGDSSLNFLLRI